MAPVESFLCITIIFSFFVALTSALAISIDTAVTIGQNVVVDWVRSTKDPDTFTLLLRDDSDSTSFLLDDVNTDGATKGQVTIDLNFSGLQAGSYHIEAFDQGAAPADDQQDDSSHSPLSGSNPFQVLAAAVASSTSSTVRSSTTTSSTKITDTTAATSTTASSPTVPDVGKIASTTSAEANNTAANQASNPTSLSDTSTAATSFATISATLPTTSSGASTSDAATLDSAEGSVAPTQTRSSSTSLPTSSSAKSNKSRNLALGLVFGLALPLIAGLVAFHFWYMRWKRLQATRNFYRERMVKNISEPVRIRHSTNYGYWITDSENQQNRSVYASQPEAEKRGSPPSPPFESYPDYERALEAAYMEEDAKLQ